MDPDLTTVHCRTRQFQINQRKIQRICTTILTSVGLARWAVDVEFVSPRLMRRLNNDYRHKDKPTDVLSFPQIEWRTPQSTKKTGKTATKILNHLHHLGDIAICPKVADKNAKDLEHGLDRETGFLLVHGILHLCGHDHMKPTEEKRMLQEQKKLMKILSKNGQPLWKNCISQRRRA